jgi:hypothetical protein
MALAHEKGIPVHLVELTAKPPVPIWDFSQSQVQIEEGYQQMKSYLINQREASIASSSWIEWISRTVSLRKRKTPDFYGEKFKAGSKK